MQSVCIMTVHYTATLVARVMKRGIIAALAAGKIEHVHNFPVNI